ncbi:hypothetical protein [Pseudooceanicola aestuarii]|uniref:hypothetical protein n=1 Tax=Pseudooceanicola aestuarii TaxID=2697319 RepID=UPI0013D6E0E9|nr:hypothetical protein [Pseudooceanicola aestuarii]
MSETSRPSGPAAAARLRDRIDRNGTGDKLAFEDPAAAPLGTDAEAAGHPPTAEEVAHAAAVETGRAKPADRKKSPAELQGNRLSFGVLLAVLAGVLGGIGLLVWLV